MHRLAATLPPEPAKLIGLQMIDMVKSSDDKKGLGLVGALALALFGTRNAAGSVIAALNVAFEVRETRGMVVLNLMALALAGAAVLAAIMAVIAMAAVSVFSRQLEGSPELLLGLHKTVWCAALALWGVVAAATLYRYAPSHEEHRRIFIAPGAVMTAICWTVLTLGFGAYASRVAHFNVIYGSLSAVVMMLTWLYLSSYALLFGAELNCEWAREAFTDENGRFEQQHVAQEPPACPSTRAAPP